MRRHLVSERPEWKAQAERLGFIFHTMYGQTYWDESRYYSFSLDQIETDLEDPATALHLLCCDAVEVVVNSPEWLTRLQIPEAYWDWIAASWRRGDPSLYGRFDFAYDGSGPAKLLEYNADTPTSLYESAFFQWLWLEDNIAAGRLPPDADQFNAIQERLIARLAEMFDPGTFMHFAACKGSDEDRQTVRYLEDCAAQAGLRPQFVHVEDIGVDAQGRFADDRNMVIDALFKLYPWEDMLRETFGHYLPGAPTRFVEPPWKAILSNKGVLALLWELFPGHPNLLPAYFDGDPRAAELGPAHVRKPLFSREGANVTLIPPDGPSISVDGAYGAEGYVVQAYTPLARFGDDHTVIGAWIIGDRAAGIGLREDTSPVTRDLSRFVPHAIVDAS